jgi:hypothetical protein
MLQASVYERYVVVKFLYMCKSIEKNVCCRKSEFVPSLQDRDCIFKSIFQIRYVDATENEGMTSNLYIFVVLNTKEFRIIAASIGGDFHIFKVVLNLI